MTLGIFINPGHVGDKLPAVMWQANNRSFEYDTLSGQYARFLLEEILPEVETHWNLTRDPEMRAYMRAVFRRDLRLHGGLGASGCVPQGHVAHRLIH